jgi:integrase
MPFVSKQWQRVKYRGGYLIGIKQHIEDKSRFLFEVNIRTLRRRQFVKIDEQGLERIQAAIDRYTAFRAEIKAGYHTNAVTFEEMFIRMMAIKNVSTRWRELQEATYRNHIARHIGSMNIRDIRPHHIDQVQANARAKAPATLKGIMDIVKATLRHALEDKIILSLPIEKRHDVKVIAAQQKTIVTDAPDRFRAVHKAIMGEFESSPVMRGIFLFGLYGRRKAEVLRMRWEHINFKTARYTIPGKHSKVKIDFEFALPSEIADTLKQISGRRRGLVFKHPRTRTEYTNIQPQIEQIRRASGWDRFTFHAMRNLLASMLHSRGVSTGYISSVLGHTNPATVQQYLTMNRANTEIETAVNALIFGTITGGGEKQTEAATTYSPEQAEELRAATKRA